MKYEFRGLNPKTNKWICGYRTSADTINDKRVKISSISLWSGEVDTRGKRIYENDIVKAGTDYFKVIFSLDKGFKLRKLGEIEDSDFRTELTIIGYEEVCEDNDRILDFSFNYRKSRVFNDFDFRT